MLPEALAGFSQALWDELTQNDLDSRLLFAAPMTDSFTSDPLLDVLSSQGEERGECVCALRCMPPGLYVYVWNCSQWRRFRAAWIAWDFQERLSRLPLSLLMYFYRELGARNLWCRFSRRRKPSSQETALVQRHWASAEQQYWCAFPGDPCTFQGTELQLCFFPLVAGNRFRRASRFLAGSPSLSTLVMALPLL